jgi:hypothetical protein
MLVATIARRHPEQWIAYIDTIGFIACESFSGAGCADGCPTNSEPASKRQETSHDTLPARGWQVDYSGSCADWAQKCVGGSDCSLTGNSYRYLFDFRRTG